jgi:secondary thiamine-phosphate synthase enzyme
MEWIQKEIQLRPYPRGFHLVTETISEEVPEIRDWTCGQLQVFIKHTSASLSLNENADPSVRVDFESFFNRTVPENATYFTHIYEGSDDMPAHLKAALLGYDVQLPIRNGRLHLGTWQGVYLGEHRNHGGGRRLLLTAWGKKA